MLSAAVLRGVRGHRYSDGDLVFWRREARRQGLNPAVVTDSVMLIVVAGLVGGRLYYIAFSQGAYYLAHPKAARASPWSSSGETRRSSPGSSSPKR